MKREKAILCTLLLINAALLAAAAIWVNTDAYHRHKELWEIHTPWPSDKPKSIIDFYPPSIFDYFCGLFFLFSLAVCGTACFAPAKNSKSGFIQPLRFFTAIAAILLIVRYTMEQSDYLEFMSVVHIDEKESPLYFIKKDVILLSSLSCGIATLVWLVIAILPSRALQDNQSS